jgi:hypothetical protein
MNQHSYYLGVRNGKVETVWDVTGINKYR